MSKTVKNTKNMRAKRPIKKPNKPFTGLIKKNRDDNDDFNLDSDILQ